MNREEEEKNPRVETLNKRRSQCMPTSLDKKDVINISVKKGQAELDFIYGKARNSIAIPVACFNSDHGHKLSEISLLSETKNKAKGPLCTLSQILRKNVESNQNSEANDGLQLQEVHSYIDGENYHGQVTKSTPVEKNNNQNRSDKNLSTKIKEERVSLAKGNQDYGRVDLSDKYFITTKRLCIRKSFSAIRKKSNDRERIAQSYMSNMNHFTNNKQSLEISHNDFSIVNDSISPLLQVKEPEYKLESCSWNIISDDEENRTRQFQIISNEDKYNDGGFAKNKSHAYNNIISDENMHKQNLFYYKKRPVSADKKNNQKNEIFKEGQNEQLIMPEVNQIIIESEKDINKERPQLKSNQRYANDTEIENNGERKEGKRKITTLKNITDSQPSSNPNDKKILLSSPKQVDRPSEKKFTGMGTGTGLKEISTSNCKNNNIISNSALLSAVINERKRNTSKTIKSTKLYFNDQNDESKNNMNKCLNDSTGDKKSNENVQRTKILRALEKKMEESSPSLTQTPVTQIKNRESYFNQDNTVKKKSPYLSLREKIIEAHLNSDKNIRKILYNFESKRGKDDIQSEDPCENDERKATISTNEEPVQDGEITGQKMRKMYTQLQDEIESLNNSQPMENTRLERIEQCGLKFSNYYNKMISKKTEDGVNVNEGTKPQICTFGNVNSKNRNAQSKLISNHTGSAEHFSTIDDTKGKLNKSAGHLSLFPAKEMYSNYLNHIDPEFKYRGDLNIDRYNFDSKNSISALNRIIADIRRKSNLPCSVKNNMAEDICKQCKEYFRQKAKLDTLQNFLESNEKRAYARHHFSDNTSSVKSNSQHWSSVLRNTCVRSIIYPSNEIDYTEFKIWNDAASKLCVNQHKKSSVI